MVIDALDELANGPQRRDVHYYHYNKMTVNTLPHMNILILVFLVFGPDSSNVADVVYWNA